jgi:PAS domain S-box-containing protein
MRSPSAPRPAPVDAALRRAGALLALVAVLLPVAGLLWAGERARDSVVERVEAGQAATAQAVAAQFAHAFAQAVTTSRAATSRPGLVDALRRRDDVALHRTLISTSAASPFTGLEVYDAAGARRAAAGLRLPALRGGLPTQEQVGRPAVAGDDSLVDLLEPIGSGGHQAGTLRLRVSLMALLPDPAGLRFGRTGTSSLIDASGVFLLTPDRDLRGRRASNAGARRLAASHLPGSTQLYSPFSHARVILSYAPVPAGTLGVFTRQYESEAFATADRLRTHLRLAAGTALLLGLALLAAALGLLRSYRAELQARDAAFRGVVERSRDILSRFDAGHRAVFVSPAVVEVLGWSVEERLGRSPLDLVHPEDRRASVRAAARHAEHDTITHTCRLRHRDGHDVWAETTTVVTRGADGAVTGYDAVTRDVSERHRTQLELAAARDAALDASVGKSVFLANTSHELRTPLNGILGLTEVLLGTDLDAQQHEYALAAHASGRTLLTILDDILDLAKIEAGKVQLEQVPFELAAVVERTVSPFRPLVAAAGTRLEVELDPRLPRWVLGDPTRFGQVLANLVSNAVKFTPAGSVRVLLATGRDRDGQVQVQVADTGIGIPPETLGRLFTSFTQAAPSTARHFGGTGLGLAVSRQLAELQGGSLEAVSEDGVGSTFLFAVPLPPAAAPVTSTTTDRPEAAARPLRVLVAEDNLVNQLVVRTMLEQLGHVVDVVPDGAAAVAAVLDGDARPDVVLMDCQMPVLDGYDATRRIRAAEPPGRRVPVLGLSASAMTGDRAKGLAAGMDSYLTKPIALRDLHLALAGVEPAPDPAPQDGRHDAVPAQRPVGTDRVRS